MKGVLNATAVVFTTILLSAFANGSIAVENEGAPSKTAPPSVLEKYQQMLSGPYEKSLGVKIESCEKEGKVVYVVSGSGGFTGVKFYYDSAGREIGSYYWDDVIEPDEPSPPIDLSNYECTVLKRSPGSV